jgi:hypothetical protein
MKTKTNKEVLSVVHKILREASPEAMSTADITKSAIKSGLEVDSNQVYFTLLALRKETKTEYQGIVRVAHGKYKYDKDSKGPDILRKGKSGLKLQGLNVKNLEIKEFSDNVSDAFLLSDSKGNLYIARKVTN